MLQGEQARKEKSLGGRAVLQALRSNLSLLGELAARYEAAFQPERPEGKASPWRAGRTHGEQARKFLPWSGTSGRAVGSGTAGRTPATDEASSSPDSQHPQHPGFAKPKRPATTTANICNIRALNSPSIQQLQLPTSATSRFRKAEASSNYNCQHLQHPGFEQPKHPATTTANICSVQVSQSRSIQQLQPPTSTASRF